MCLQTWGWSRKVMSFSFLERYLRTQGCLFIYFYFFFYCYRDSHLFLR